MRRLLIVAVALALPLSVAGIAAGGDLEAFCADRPDHPRCQEDPDPPAPPDFDVAGFSCAEAAVYYGLPDRLEVWAPDPAGDLLEVTLTPEESAVCIDLMNPVAGSFTVDVIDPGSAGGVSASIRDSHPGDFCSGGTPSINPKKGELSLPLGVMPAATLNACGLEYGEADLDASGEVAFETWEANPAVADPMVFMLRYGKSGPTTVVLEVTFTPGS
jgi:hypothetical protein